jgi:hypothetical protein
MDDDVHPVDGPLDSLEVLEMGQVKPVLRYLELLLL